MPVPDDERLRELADASLSICNKHVNGTCYTRACMVRGGWKQGQPDFTDAICPEMEVAAACRAVIAARALERQWEREESALRKSPDGDGMDEACADGIADCRAELSAILSPGNEGGGDAG